jgi:hypothetical protein
MQSKRSGNNKRVVHSYTGGRGGKGGAGGGRSGCGAGGRGGSHSGSRGTSRNSNFKPSYLDRLKSGEKKVSNPSDAQQLFRQLLKHKEAPETMVILVDHSLITPLQTAINVLLPSPGLNLVMELLTALGAEAMRHGVYKDKALICFRALFELEELMELITKRLADPYLDPYSNAYCNMDAVTIAWMLLALAQEKDIRGSHMALKLLQTLQSDHLKSVGGLQQVLQRLSTMFASITEDAQGTYDQDRKATFTPLTSLQAAKNAMRGPGLRDHDNDFADYRDIDICPTPRELMCTEHAYLPPITGAEHITNREASLLDRQFRLLREDMIGPILKEMKEELATDRKNYKRVFGHPRLMDMGFKQRPHFIVEVALPLSLTGRVMGVLKQVKGRDGHGHGKGKDKAAQKLNRKRNKALNEFFDTGPGKRVLRNGTLVVLFNQGKQTIEAQRQMSTKRSSLQGLPPSIVAVGVVINREIRLHGLRPSLQVELTFPGAESLRTVVSLLRYVASYEYRRVFNK